MTITATQKGKVTAAYRLQMVVDGAKILPFMFVKLVSAPLNEGSRVVVKPREHRHRHFFCHSRQGAILLLEWGYASRCF